MRASAIGRVGAWGLRTSVWMLTLALVGCAVTRGIVDVQVPVPPAPGSGDGPLVMFSEIEDVRAFELAPSRPSIPSLKDGNISDVAITSRAIARKRNGYGKAMGDILLPEGRSVSGLVRDALTRAFRESGYRVVSPGDPEAANAAPLRVRVDQFWAWFTPGFFAAKLDFQTRIDVEGPLAPFEDGERFEASIRKSTQAASGGAWLNTINGGLEDLNQQIRARLTSQ